MKKSVLLAFSGGLDTSYCVKYLLHEKDLEVHTAFVHTGGMSACELENIHQKAMQLGAKSHKNLEESANFYSEIIRFLVYGNITRGKNYPLCVSAERIHQASAIARYANTIGVDYLAHGSTGAGNDQVRFDLVFRLLTPELPVLTPIRDQQLSRATEVAYLQSFGVDWPREKARYSINEGVWGTSIGGAETLGSREMLPEAAFPYSPVKSDPEPLSIAFEKGEISAVNDESGDPVYLIGLLNTIGHDFAIGRGIHVGDTIIGMKGRVGFEAPAATMILQAHQYLEKHTLSQWQQYWKDQLGEWYGMLLHEARFFDPVMRNIECFLENTQSTVTGKVYLRLAPYRFQIEGIESPYDLMTGDWGQYGESHNAWSGDDVKGFTRILSNAMHIQQQVSPYPPTQP